ncbi:hypothetical protein M0804_013169 [Polistes exclamans]|nr:hypothetical protein M0804_013169 [Polistes exclamans]
MRHERVASYRDALVKVREKVKLKEVRIDGFRIRRRVTGAFISELRGVEAKGKAEKFAKALGLALSEAEVSLLTRLGDILVCGLDAGVTRGVVIGAVVGLVPGVQSRYVKVGRGRLGQVYV